MLPIKPTFTARRHRKASPCRLSLCEGGDEASTLRKSTTFPTEPGLSSAWIFHSSRRISVCERIVCLAMLAAALSCVGCSGPDAKKRSSNVSPETTSEYDGKNAPARKSVMEESRDHAATGMSSLGPMHPSDTNATDDFSVANSETVIRSDEMSANSRLVRSADDTVPPSAGLEDRGTDTKSANNGLMSAQPERILFLAREGPLVLDVHLTISGKTPAESLEHLLEEVMLQIAPDRESPVPWDSLLAHPMLEYGQLGNLNAESEAERIQLTRMYDANGDGLVDQGELARFLTRNSGGARAFSLRSANFYYDIHRRDSPLATVLDKNGDGVLDATEIGQATERLKQYDMNDDELWFAEDFRRAGDDLPPPLTQRRPNLPDSIISLGQLRDWGTLLFELETIYALGQPITSEHLPRQLDRFAALDVDGDGIWRAGEMKGWREVESDLELALHFDLSSVAESDPLPDAGLDEATSRNSDRLLADDSGSPDISKQDSATRSTNAPLATPAPVEVLTTSNHLRERMEEIRVLADRLVLVVPGTKLTIYVKDVDDRPGVQASRATLSQIRARAGNDRDALFSLLDQDHDGRLTAREVATAAARLRAFDRNGDGQLDLDEIPDAYLLVFARGPVQNDGTTFQVFPLPERYGSAPPDWFQAMDRNQDGELSRREFLGTEELFQKLDVNGDGFLELRELSRDAP
jgi:Ca2+-binding EF-hand superfamily protein